MLAYVRRVRDENEACTNNDPARGAEVIEFLSQDFATLVDSSCADAAMDKLEPSRQAGDSSVGDPLPATADSPAQAA